MTDEPTDNRTDIRTDDRTDDRTEIPTGIPGGIPADSPVAPGWPGSIVALTLFAEDLASTRRFYEEVFGLPVVYEDEESAVFRFGGTLLNLLRSTAAVELIEPAEVAPPHAGSRLQLTLEVDDVDAVCKQLAARGVTLLNGPMDRPWGIRTASFRDPAGHIWEIAR